MSFRLGLVFVVSSLACAPIDSELRSLPGEQAAAGAAGAPSFGGAGEGGSGGAASAGGAGGGGGDGCPAEEPPGPFALRFDVATLHCSAGGSCTGDEDKCLCQDDFDALNLLPGHFMAVGTDNHKAKIWQAGNAQAVYVDDLNTNWQAGGAARADAVILKAEASFPCGVPKWFIVNEISAGQWPGNAAYRQFVIDFAATMHESYDKNVIVAAPFATPGANGASWSALAEHAYVGAEVYLSGKEVNASGNSVNWCRAQYQASIDAYAARGVPKSRLIVFEHFANSDGTVGWGRGGVSVAGWHNAIEARSQALSSLGFAGFVSYAWGGNAMHAPEADRLAFMETYRTGPALP